jgi:DNA repair exonuclease SbcCD ATPase subunit
MDSPGLHLVLGSNLDNKSFDSNGSGKSALFEAVIWGLFGEFLRSGESVDNIIRKGEKTCSVVLTVDPEDGSGDVVINRSRSSKKGLLTVTRASDGGALFPAGNVNEKQAELNEWLGTDFTTFTNSVYFGKGLAKFFMLSNDNDRKDLLESILKIVSFDKPLEAAKNKLSTVSQKLGVVQSNIEKKAAVLFAENVRLEDQRKQLDAVTAKVNEVKTDKTVEVTKLINQKALIQMDIDVFEEYKGRYQRILDAVATEVRQMRNTGDSLIASDAAKKRGDVTKEYTDKKAAIQVEYDTELAELDTELEEINSVLVPQQELWASYGTEWHTFNGRLQAVVSQLNSFSNVYANQTCPTCPTCYSDVSEDHVASVVARLTKQKEDLAEALRQKEEVKRALETDVLDPLNKALANNSKDRLALDGNRGTKLAYLNAAIAKLNADITEWVAAEKRKLDDKCAKLERQKSNEANAELNNTAILLADANTRYTEVSNRIKVLSDELVAVDLAQTTLAAAVKKSESVISGYEEELKALEAEKVVLEQEIPMLEFCVEAFSTKGIRSFIFENSLPFITERANYYSTYLTGGTIQIDISPTTTTKTTGNVKEKIAVTATNSIGSEVYGSNSDGERRRVDVCIILALQDLIASRATKPWKLMIFDEVMDSLDDTGIQNLIDMLRAIASDSAVFIISHSSSLRQHFDEVLTVVKENGVSRVS